MRRALRPSFVVTFALFAAAIVSGCSSNSPVPNYGSIGCPNAQPAPGAPCNPPPVASPCDYGFCNEGPAFTAVCQKGAWSVQAVACNAPAPAYDAGPDGEGQDGGHD